MPCIVGTLLEKSEVDGSFESWVLKFRGTEWGGLCHVTMFLSRD